MSTGEIPEFYVQEPCWRPDKLDPVLEDKAQAYKESSEPNIALENEVAKALAKASLRLFGGQAEVYRTERAIAKHGGNCFARAEGSIGIGEELDLDMLLLWNGAHASALWVARSRVWCIDSLHSLWGSRPWGTIQSKTPSQHTKLGHKIMSKAGGRAFIDPDATILSAVKWKPIEGELGDNQFPYKRNLLLLPGQEGVSYLAAVGDRVFLKRRKPPEYLQALGSQIDRYIIRPNSTS